MEYNNPLHIIILGSNPASRLALIRSVGQVGNCRVTIINMVNQMPSKKHRPFDAYSKYVDQVFFSKKFDADGLSKLLLEKCRDKESKPIIMSVDDDSACLIDNIQDRLKDDFYFPHICNEPGAIARLMDKQVQKELAKEFGFRVANSWTADINNGEYVIPEGVTFPCYVKGRLSYHSAKCFQKKCNTWEELKTWLSVIAKNNPSPLLIEEYISVDKEYGLIGYSNTEKVVIPAIVDLYDAGKGSDKGVAATGRVNDTSLNEEIKTKVEKMVKHLQLTGMFNIDFVESNGQWYFIEINVRFAAYGYAVCMAGVNLPAFQIYNALSKEDIVLPTEVKSGYSYVNEKVAFDDVLGGYETWSQYRNLIRKADCRMIRQDEDPRPYRHYKKEILLDYLKVGIKRMLHIK